MIGLIYAQASNGVIGNKGKIPWHIPEDFKRFKEVTTGTSVIMGRKTWESLPDKFRPLPNRRNIVLTRQSHVSLDGAIVANSIEEAFDKSDNTKDIWVIGGSEIYNLAYPFAERVLVTMIHKDFEGDAYAPELGLKWILTDNENHITEDGLEYSFLTYLRSPLFKQE